MNINKVIETHARNIADEKRNLIGDDPDEHGYEDSDNIKLPDGETVSMKELVGGYMRQKDYTQKTQKISDERRELLEEKKDIQEDKKSLEENKEFLNYIRIYFNQNKNAYDNFVNYFEGDGKEISNQEESNMQEDKNNNGGDKTKAAQIVNQGLPTEIQKKLEQLDVLMENIKMINKERATDKVSTATGYLRDKYKLSDEQIQEIKNTAEKNYVNGIGIEQNLENAYRIWHHDKAIDEGKQMGFEEMRSKLEASNVPLPTHLSEKEKTKTQQFKEFISGATETILGK